MMSVTKVFAFIFANASIVLSALSAEFSNEFVELKFSPEGQLSSIREKSSGRELIGDKCSFMDITLEDGRVFPASSMYQNEKGNLVFRFSPIGGEAEISLTPYKMPNSDQCCKKSQNCAGCGWTIETVRFDVPNVKTWTIAHVKPSCDKWYGDMACLVSDEKSGVALRAYDPLLRTACDEIPNRDPHSLYDAPDKAFYPTKEQVESGLMIRADQPDSFIGRKCGIAAGPRSSLIMMLKAMTLAADVPYSKAGGAWALECEANRGSYVFTTCMDVASTEDWIEMAELGGFTTVHPYAWWVNYGLYEFNREWFPNGIEDLAGAAKKFHDAGFRFDLHHLSHCVQYIEPCFLPEVTVDPEELVERCTYTLARPFAPGDTEMYVNEKPWDGHTIIMRSHANGNALIIGREVVQYHAISFEKPYRFSKISRGSFETQYFGSLPVKISAETFPVGTKVKYMQQRYGSFYPKPGSKLMERVSERIGEVFNACKADGVYFDGAEGMMTIYGTEKGRETTFRKFRQKDNEIIAESACLYPYSWWYRSRIGPWDHAEWGAKRFIDEHIRCLDEYAVKANLLRVNLGWWGPMMGCYMARQHFSDEMEYNGCKGAAIDAADGFQLPDPLNSINAKPVYFHTEDQLVIFGRWERARLAKAFDESMLKRLRVPGDEFRLRQDGEGLWRVYPQNVKSHKISDAPYSSWTVEESEERDVELRVEALYCGDEYYAENSYPILEPSDLPVLEKESCEGVEIDVSKSRDASRGDTLVINAQNTNQFSDGAWVRVGKHTPVPYIAVTNAVGIWVKGDGSGALLNVQIEQALACYHGYSEHYVRLDFEGWRYFALQLRERDAYDYFNHKWPYSHYRLNTATEVYRTEIMGRTVERVNLWLNDVPVNGKTRVEVSAVRAIGRHKAVTKNAVINFNGREIPVPFEMKSTEVAELVDGYWTLLGDNGSPIARKVGPKNLKTIAGKNTLSWIGDAGNDFPRAEVTLISVGKGDEAFVKEATKSPRLQFEPERPLIYNPSAGLSANQTVVTRPNETAQLEIRIVGPIENPSVNIGNVAYDFKCTLLKNDILRCVNGRDWRVIRVKRGSREVMAQGTLERPILPFTGRACVSITSSNLATAKARISVAKRYKR
jgi:hypothetical protein